MNKCINQLINNFNQMASINIDVIMPHSTAKYNMAVKSLSTVRFNIFWRQIDEMVHHFDCQIFDDRVNNPARPQLRVRPSQNQLASR